MNPSPNDKSGKVDIKKLIKENPNDPRRGQGYNDARGDFPDTELDNDFKNLKNHTGPEQKQKKDPHVGVVRIPEDRTNAEGR